MRQESHRVPHVCDKSGDWTLARTTRRRLDGYRLYSASHVRIRSEKEAGGRRVRRGARQLRRRRDLAQGDRYPVRADTVVEHHRRRLKGRATRITIDLDPTDDPTHGQQELTFFNGHYDTWCYLPVVATVTFGDEAAQYAVAAVLRPGNAPASLGACGLLPRLIRQLRPAFPPATLPVRLHAGFATPTVLTLREAQAVA